VEQRRESLVIPFGMAVVSSLLGPHRARLTAARQAQAEGASSRAWLSARHRPPGRAAALGLHVAGREGPHRSVIMFAVIRVAASEAR
jgi:hypothetical protein